MCFGSLAGVTNLRYTVLMSPKKGQTAVHCCACVPALSPDSCQVGVLKRFSRSICLAAYCLKNLKYLLELIYFLKFPIPRSFLSRVYHILNNSHFLDLKDKQKMFTELAPMAVTLK